MANEIDGIVDALSPVISNLIKEKLNNYLGKDKSAENNGTEHTQQPDAASSAGVAAKSGAAGDVNAASAAKDSSGDINAASANSDGKQ